MNVSRTLWSFRLYNIIENQRDSRKSDFAGRYTRRFSPSGMDNDFRNVPRKHPPRHNAD